jgi:hypothetical protein
MFVLFFSTNISSLWDFVENFSAFVSVLSIIGRIYGFVIANIVKQSVSLWEFPPLLVFSTNNRKNTFTSDYQIVTDETYSFACFRTSRWTMRLSKKHQTTADELGTPITAKRNGEGCQSRK